MIFDLAFSRKRLVSTLLTFIWLMALMTAFCSLAPTPFREYTVCPTITSSGLFTTYTSTSTSTTNCAGAVGVMDTLITSGIAVRRKRSDIPAKPFAVAMLVNFRSRAEEAVPGMLSMS